MFYPLKSKKFHLSQEEIHENYNLESLFKRWEEYEKSLKELNPYKRNKGIHPTGAFKIEKSILDQLKTPQDYFFNEKKSRFQFDDEDFMILRGCAYYPGVESYNLRRLTSQVFSDYRTIMKSLQTKFQRHTRHIIAELDYAANYLFVFLHCTSILSQYLKIHTNRIAEKIDNMLEQLILHLLNAIDGNEIYLSVIELERLEDLEKIIVDNMNIIEDKLNYRRFYRATREHNDLYLLKEYCKNISRIWPGNAIMIAIEYGAISLPYFINAIRYKQGSQKIPYKFFNSYNRSENVFNDIKAESVVIIDDTIATGYNIQKVIDVLPLNVKNIFVSAVSFSRTNWGKEGVWFKNGGVDADELEKCYIPYHSAWQRINTGSFKTVDGSHHMLEKSCIQKHLVDQYPFLETIKNGIVKL